MNVLITDPSLIISQSILIILFSIVLIVMEQFFHFVLCLLEPYISTFLEQKVLLIKEINLFNTLSTV